MIEGRVESGLARALADAALAIEAPGRLELALEAVAQAARDALPGFDHVGVTVVKGHGGVTTPVATDRLAFMMDHLQYKVDEGPCLDAVRQSKVVLAEDLPAMTHQWPKYAERASRAGIRAQMGVHVHTSDETLGGLNFYSTTAATIDPLAPRDAAIFASHAAIALDHARHVHDEAVPGIPTHELVRQAAATLMARFDVTEDRAMYYLVRIAAARDLKLRDAARDVVNQVNRRAN
jgi:GAF domain-containing protein